MLSRHSVWFLRAIRDGTYSAVAEANQTAARFRVCTIDWAELSLQVSRLRWETCAWGKLCTKYKLGGSFSEWRKSELRKSELRKSELRKSELRKNVKFFVVQSSFFRRIAFSSKKAICRFRMTKIRTMEIRTTEKRLVFRSSVMFFVVQSSFFVVHGSANTKQTEWRDSMTLSPSFGLDWTRQTELCTKHKPCGSFCA